jgi:hypothetical protein
MAVTNRKDPAADQREALRRELLRLIVKNEAKRREERKPRAAEK